MTDSGVKCDCQVKEEFERLCKHLYRYITFKVSDDKTKIVVDKIGGLEKTFDDFKNDIPKDGVRYAVYDLEYETKEHQKRDKVVFISFAPDCLPPHDKMMCSSSKKAVVDCLGNGVQHKFQRSEHSDIILEEMVDELKTKYT